ncbi:hypothetical protein SAMN05421823_101388 [Catalinimonas alkaloidigena]|uniref:PQQ-like domain-containing protein n=1 Tax=Catalinimonas alkaloidigena TaxID=1075417 RepID=A0A1G8XJI9_9BACT|nr:hypothetical protein [Catalinimonas alkaloidigena]SDJ90731.1 hypothetical protein SAMN05421823_101388 [Catalinimonas alkaloidigena]
MKKLYLLALLALLLGGAAERAVAQPDYCQDLDFQFGTTQTERLQDAIRTRDGGLLLVGYRSVVNIGRFDLDYWIVKLDKHNNLEWQRLIGSMNDDYVQTVTEDTLNDGGFVVAGYTTALKASGNISMPSTDPYRNGITDIWMAKISFDGKELLWERRLGGYFKESVSSITLTKNGTYLMSGRTNSLPETGDLGRDKQFGGYDLWLVEINKNGVVMRDKRIGTPHHDKVEKIICTTDGGYLLAGHSTMMSLEESKQEGNLIQDDTDSEESLQERNAFVVQLDGQLNERWRFVSENPANEAIYSVTPTREGGYLVAGYIQNSVFMVQPQNAVSQFSKDIWLAKLNAGGELIWEKRFGGNSDEIAYNVVSSDDGNFLIGGISNSLSMQGAKDGANLGNYDYWLLSVDERGTKKWDATYGGTGEDRLIRILPQDNGILLAGWSNSVADGTKMTKGNGGNHFWLTSLSRDEVGTVECTISQNILSQDNTLEPVMTEENIAQSASGL